MGYSHPDYLLSELTGNQIAEWEAFNQINPIDKEFRLEFAFANLSALIYAIVKDKNSSSLKAVDFMPQWNETEKKDKKQDVDQMKNILMGFVHRTSKKGGK